MNEDNKKCTLTDEALIDVCETWISKLCATGGRAFTMTVPPRMNYDTDMVLSELVKRFKKLIEEKPSQP